MTIQERYEIGKPIFEKIFALPANEIKALVNDITGNKDCYEDVFTNGTVYKETANDEPHELKISSYDTIKITSLGIYFRSEHGRTATLYEFTKYTKI